MTTATRSAVVSALTAEFQKPEYSGLPATGKGSKAALLLQRPLVANPDPPDQVPAPLDPVALMGLVPDLEYKKMDGEFRTSVLQAVQSNNTGLLSLIAASGVKLGYLTAATVSAISAELAKTIDDPNHPGQVLGDSPWQTIVAANGWTGLLNDDAQSVMETGSVPTAWIEEATV